MPTWVKATDRLPEKRKVLAIKDDGDYARGYLRSDGSFVTGYGENRDVEIIEWLDESTPDYINGLKEALENLIIDYDDAKDRLTLKTGTPHHDTPMIAAAKIALSQFKQGNTGDGWISVEDRLPVTNEKFGESDYVLGFEMPVSDQVVCWYNKKTGWHVAHHKADSLPITISHWMPLPQPPKQQP